MLSLFRASAAVLAKGARNRILASLGVIFRPLVFSAKHGVDRQGSTKNTMAREFRPWFADFDQGSAKTPRFARGRNHPNHPAASKAHQSAQSTPPPSPRATALVPTIAASHGVIFRPLVFSAKHGVDRQGSTRTPRLARGRNHPAAPKAPQFAQGTSPARGRLPTLSKSATARPTAPGIAKGRPLRTALLSVLLIKCYLLGAFTHCGCAACFEAGNRDAERRTGHVCHA